MERDEQGQAGVEDPVESHEASFILVHTQRNNRRPFIRCKVSVLSLALWTREHNDDNLNTILMVGYSGQ